MHINDDIWGRTDLCDFHLRHAAMWNFKLRKGTVIEFGGVSTMQTAPVH